MDAEMADAPATTTEDPPPPAAVAMAVPATTDEDPPPPAAAFPQIAHFGLPFMAMADVAVPTLSLPLAKQHALISAVIFGGDNEECPALIYIPRDTILDLSVPMRRHLTKLAIKMCERGDSAGLIDLLDRRAMCPNGQRSFDTLSAAARANSVECVSAILLEGAGNALARNFSLYHPYSGIGQTALHSAAEVDAPECIALLIAAGADPNTVTTTGLAPLHVGKWAPGVSSCCVLPAPAHRPPCTTPAAQFGNLEVVKVLVNYNEPGHKRILFWRRWLARACVDGRSRIYRPCPSWKEVEEIVAGMRAFKGLVRFAVWMLRARARAREALYRPGGKEMVKCKQRFEAMQEGEGEGDPQAGRC